MIYRQKDRLDASTYTVSASSLTLGCGVRWILFTHRTDRLGWCFHSPFAWCLVLGFEHLVQDTHCGDKLQRVRNAFQEPRPCRHSVDKGSVWWEGLSRGRGPLGPSLLPWPWGRPCRTWWRPSLRDPRVPHREAQPQKAPPRPCPRAPASSNTGKPVPNP